MSRRPRARKSRLKKAGSEREPTGAPARAPLGTLGTARLWMPYACVAVLSILTIVAYSGTLDVPFLLDDNPHIVKEPAIRPPATLSKLLDTERPLVTATLALNYAAGGLEVGGYHAFNLFAHIICGLVFFGFVRSVLREPVNESRYGSSADAIALFAAGVFLLHPIQTESVTYVIQRGEVLVTTALLAALWLAARIARRGSPGLIAGLATVCVLGVLSKELLVMLPLVFLLYDWCFIAEGRRNLLAPRGQLYGWLVGVALIAAVWGLSANSQTEMGGFGMEEIRPWEYLSMQFGVLAYYLRLVFYPDPLCFDCGYWKPWPVLHSSLGDAVVLPALVLAGLALGAWLLRRRMPVVTFGMLAAALVLVPTSSIMPLADVYVEHRLYLPIGLVALAMAAMAVDLGKLVLGDRGRMLGRALGLGVSAATCAALVWMTVARNGMYDDAISLYKQALTIAPESERANYNLANILRRDDRNVEAIVYYQKAVELNPESSRNFINLGNSYLALRELARAGEAFEAGRALSPDLPLVNRNLASVYLDLRRYTEGIGVAEHAVELDPRNVRGRKLLGLLYQRAGRTSDALAQFRVALQLDPRDRSLQEQVARLVRVMGP